MKTAVRYFFVLGLIFTITSCDLFDEINTSDASLQLYGENPRDVYDGTANNCDGNDDEILSQGETARIQLRLNNTGEEEAEGVKITVSSIDRYVSVIDGHSQTLGDLEVSHYGQTAEANSPGSILITAEPGTPSGHIADFEVVIRDKQNNKWTDEFSMVVEPVSASVILYGSNNPYRLYDGSANGASGNGNSELNAGENIRVQLRIQNEGDAKVMQVRMSASTDDEFVSVADDSTYTFGDMLPYHIHETPDAQTNSALMLTADAGTPSGHTATINLTFIDKFDNEWTDSFSVVVR